MSLSDVAMVWAIFMSFSLLFILWKGAAPERLGVASIFALGVFQLSVERLMPSKFVTVDVSSLGADLIGFLAFGMIALHARRIWPLWATAFQLLCLGAHFARWASISISREAYAVLRGAPTAMAILLMLGATLLCISARKRGLIDRPWQDWDQIARGRDVPPRRGR
jgi:hypothetical protein